MKGTIDAKTREIVESLYGPEPVPTASAPVRTSAAPATAPAAMVDEKRDLSLDRPNVRAVVSMQAQTQRTARRREGRK